MITAALNICLRVSAARAALASAIDTDAASQSENRGFRYAVIPALERALRDAEIDALARYVAG